ncbi:hypothetical protein MKZ38_000023 [Zalerion maritima]|uniref:Uncharacterized protein n=1 Tax=Zalerion maritima TaxID=339359 RepID=A0AAD5RRX5_9PEZI|nr:hypothetical protein MKZ38_000023 [Zalerion maritima]
MLLASSLVGVGIMSGVYPPGDQGPPLMKSFQKYINKGISSGEGSCLDHSLGKLARQPNPTAFYARIAKQLKFRTELERKHLEGLQTENWGFDVREINATKLPAGITIWHSAQDPQVPPPTCPELH